MGFDAEKFLNTKMQPRTADVPVPGLVSWFGEGEKPVWKVRGISGQELGQAKQAVESRKDIAALVAGIVGGQSAEKAAAAKKIMNIDDTVPSNVALNIHLVKLGSVEPAADEDLAVKLCTCCPVEFQQIAKKILELTGQGHEPGKA
jgi:hypothetical protein